MSSREPLGVNSPIAGQEWVHFLEQRKQMVDQILDRIGLAETAYQGLAQQTQQMGALAQAIPPGALPATAWRAANDVVDARVQAGEYTIELPQDREKLEGAAKLYGVQDPHKLPSDVLGEIIRSKRMGVQDALKRGQPLPEMMQGGGFGERLGRGLNRLDEVLGNTGTNQALGLGAAETFVNTLQSIPFIGDALARTAAVKNSEQWLGMMGESYRTMLPGDDPKGFVDMIRGMAQGNPAAQFEAAKTVGHLAGYALMGGAAWKVAGAAGAMGPLARVGSRLGPIERAAIRGGAAEWLIEGGGDAPLEERAFAVGLGAGLGAVTEWAAPIVMKWLRRSFPTSGREFSADPENTVWWRPIEQRGYVRYWRDVSEFNYPQGEYSIPGTAMVPYGAQPSGFNRVPYPGLPRGPFTGGPGGPAGPGGMLTEGGVQGMQDLPLLGANLNQNLPLPALPNDRAALMANAQELSSRLYQLDDMIAAVDAGQPVQPMGAALDRLPGEPDQMWLRRSRAILETEFQVVSRQLDALSPPPPVSDPVRAGADAAQLSKHATILESPALATMSTQAGFDEMDVAIAALAKNPSAVHVIENVGDVAKFVRQQTQGQVGRLMPQDFRVVERQLPRTKPASSKIEPWMEGRGRSALDRQLDPAPVQEVKARRSVLERMTSDQIEAYPGGFDKWLADRDALWAEEKRVWYESDPLRATFLHEQFFDARDPEVHQRVIGLVEQALMKGDWETASLFIQRAEDVGYPSWDPVNNVEIPPPRTLTPELQRLKQVADRMKENDAEYVASREVTTRWMEGLTQRYNETGTIFEPPRPRLLPPTATPGSRGVVQASAQATPLPPVKAQTDILIAGSKRISNKMVNEYKEFNGQFTGRGVLVGGTEMEIVKPSLTGLVEVKATDGSGLTSFVRPEHLAFGRSSADVMEAPSAYSGLRTYVQKYMDNESAAAGLPQFDWFSEETATQLPRLVEEFLDQAGIENPAQRAAITAYFNQRRVQDYRLAVAEDAAEADAIRAAVANEITQAHAADRLPPAIEDLAEQRIMSVEDQPPGMGFVLVDELSDLRVPVQSEEEAIEFLQRFDRDAPDHTPLSDVPMELVGSSPGGMHPGSQGAPVRRTEDQVDVMQSTLARVGGRGGDPPPPPPPGTSYGMASDGLPPGQYNMGPADLPKLPPGQYNMGGLTIAERFRRLNNSDPRKFAQLQDDLQSTTAAAFLPMRNFTLRAEQLMYNAGIPEGKLWQHYTDVVTGIAKAHNESIPYYERIHELTRQFRRIHVRKGHVVEALEAPLTGTHVQPGLTTRQAVMDKYDFTAAERKTVADIRAFFDEVGSEAGTRYLFQYVPHIRKFQRGGKSNAYELSAMEVPREIQFFAEYAREGNIDMRELDIGQLMTHWVRAWKFKEHVGEAYDSMARAWQVHVPAGGSAIPDNLRLTIKQWLHIVRYGHGAENEMLIRGVRHTLNKLGIPVTDAEIARMYNSLFTNAYRGGLGWRPDVVFRDSIQPALTGSKIGMSWVRQAYTQFLRDPMAREAMWERALRGGWVERGQVQVAESGVFTQETPFFTAEQNPGPSAVREGLARIGDVIHDASPNYLRGGMQGKAYDPLLPYTRLGEFNRLISGDAGYQRAAQAIRAFREGTSVLDRKYQVAYAVSGRSAPTDSWEILSHNAGALAWRAPIQRRFVELVMGGQDEAAANLLANEAANMQFRYGTREASPGIQRAGMKGRIVMMFGTFTNQYLANMGELLSKDIPWFERAGFLTRMGGVTAALAGATALTGWNFNKWQWPNAATFAGGPPLHGILHFWQYMTGGLSSAAGGHVSPEQETALALEQRRMNEQGMLPSLAQTAAGALFPYAGGVQTLGNIGEAILNPGTAETLPRFMLTGERPDRILGGNVEEWFKQQGGFNDPNQMVPTNGPEAYFGAPVAPSPVTAFGVHDPRRVYQNKYGTPVVDTPNRTADGKVPTHRVDLPSGRRADESWEEYENRVLATPDSAFPDEALHVTSSLEALEPSTAARVRAMLAGAAQDGVPLAVGETYRPQARQEYLFKEGRARGQYPVTWTLTSNHAQRRAADLRAVDDRGYQWIQQNAERFGLEVFGPDDPGHVFTVGSKAGHTGTGIGQSTQYGGGFF